MIEHDLFDLPATAPPSEAELRKALARMRAHLVGLREQAHASVDQRHDAALRALDAQDVPYIESLADEGREADHAEVDRWFEEQFDVQEREFAALLAACGHGETWQ